MRVLARFVDDLLNPATRQHIVSPTTCKHVFVCVKSRKTQPTFKMECYHNVLTWIGQGRKDVAAENVLHRRFEGKPNEIERSRSDKKKRSDLRHCSMSSLPVREFKQNHGGGWQFGRLLLVE